MLSAAVVFPRVTNANPEIQRTTREVSGLLHIMATNRPETSDPALLPGRPGRLDRKIEVPLPNEQARSFRYPKNLCSLLTT